MPRHSLNNMAENSMDLSLYCPVQKYQFAGTCYAYATVYSGMSTFRNIQEGITDRAVIEQSHFSAGVVASCHNARLVFYRRSRTCDQLGTAQKALDILEQVGTVLTSDFDCSCMKFSAVKQQIPATANWQKISGYERLAVHNRYDPSFVDWIRSALQDGRPVIIGMWQNDFVRNLIAGSIDYDLPDQPTLNHVARYPKGISNHATCILGFDDSFNGTGKGYFLLKNNFQNWGNGQGFSWMPYTYLMPLIYEAYFIWDFVR